jgi:Tfp pilus assembly protein PilF
MMTTDTAKKPFNLGYLLLGAVLVLIVVGAFWIKTRSTPVPSATPKATTAGESTASLLARGIREHTAGRLDVALDLYRKVLEQDPANPHAHYNLGQIYNTRGEYAKAQWEYEATLKSEPQSTNARLNLGVVLYRQRKFAEAAEEFRKVVEASPRDAVAMADLGISLLDLGRTDEAIRWLAASVQEDPKQVNPHYYLGIARERQRQYAEARVELQKVIELSPRYAAAYAALARVYSAQGEQKLAREASAKAGQLDPHLKQ